MSPEPWWEDHGLGAGAPWQAYSVGEGARPGAKPGETRLSTKSQPPGRPKRSDSPKVHGQNLTLILPPAIPLSQRQSINT